MTPGAGGARRLPPRRVPPLRRPWAQPVARWPWAGCPQGLDGGFCGRTAHRSCSTRRPRRCWLWRPLSRTHREARGPRGQRAHRGRSAALTSRPGGARQACCETMPPRPRAPVSSDERRLTATVTWGPGAGAASPPTAPAAAAQTRAAGLRGWLRRQGVALTLASTLVLGVTWGKGSPLQVSLLTCRQNTLTSEGCCELHQTTRWTQARHFAHVTTVGRRAAGTAGGGEARTCLRPRSGLGARGPTAPVCALCPQGAGSRAHGWHGLGG